MTKTLKVLLTILTVSVAGLIFLILISPESKTSTNINPTPTPEPTKESQKEMTFMFAGDAMFGRAVYAQFHDDLKEAFENLGQGFFNNNDIAILNLEGPILEEEFTPDTDPNNLMMEFPLQTTQSLQWLGVNAVSLANNHTDNQGKAMLENTRQVLNDVKITTIGDPQNKTDLVKTFQKENQKISIIAVNILANTPDLTETIKEQKNNNADVIIFPHWGNEYQTTHSLQQETLAHAWIEAGADLIVGSHPHVIQDAEIYQEKPIFYSLGNFLFDQTFSTNTQRGLVLEGKITNDKLTIKLVPVFSKHLRIGLLAGEEKTEIINQLKKGLGLENSEGETIEFKIE